MRIKPVKIRGGGIVYAFAHPSGDEHGWVVSKFNGSGSWTGGLHNQNGKWTRDEARAAATKYRRSLRNAQTSTKSKLC